MKNIYTFLLLVGITLLLTFLSQWVLNSDALLYDSLSEQLSNDQIQHIISFNKKWQWISYALLPVLLLIKISVISSVLWMGTFFFDKNISFKKLFNIVTKAEFIFVVVSIIKISWFAFQQDYTLEDVQSFYPLSALALVGQEGLETWFVYPFQTLNLFELFYWITLAWLLSKQIKVTKDKALKIVVSSYGSALLIWVVAVMFFTLNVS
ncbi:hypothetical protein [uncultured Aquimarina sp.]|uniref:hypothetical protein n=1 Tax=uncultured Aquimarina sp. TaxID=575652 RepID=UPI00260CFB59|nr:hypothetical protein [uncultured Aquimarina sp.]